MNLILYRHLWGVAGDWETLFPAFRAAGYRGIEAAMPPRPTHQRFRQLLSRHALEYIPQIFSQGLTVAEHLRSFREQAKVASSFRPRLINAHSGRDAFSENESAQFFEEALQIERSLGVPIAHETHRGRILFNPWSTRRSLTQFPELKLCCDFSHWVCVCERLLEDQADILSLSARHCIHLHARVGYEQGPQVPDPRAPEYQRHLAAHESWWQKIWRTQSKRGFKVSTLTPEFGPPDYQHTLPFTYQPVSNLAEICDWQAQRQAQQFDRGRY